MLGLYQSLREAADRHPDTMDQRFGAWPRLLSLFRAIHGGLDHQFPHGGRLHLPPRHGHLFHPDSFPFLEGRVRGGTLEFDKPEERAAVHTPTLSDATILDVLERLLVVNGERVSYGTLGVEEIGSVYEGMLGYHIQRAVGEASASGPTAPGSASTSCSRSRPVSVSAGSQTRAYPGPTPSTSPSRSATRSPMTPAARELWLRSMSKPRTKSAPTLPTPR